MVLAGLFKGLLMAFEAAWQGQCVICMDNLANLVCLPCKHLAICSLCNAIAECPMCWALGWAF